LRRRMPPEIVVSEIKCNDFSLLKLDIEKYWNTNIIIENSLYVYSVQSKKFGIVGVKA
jgi:hypothetical protein